MPQVRSMTDSRGQSAEEAGPSHAVQLVGLNGVPVAGDEFAAVDTEQEVRTFLQAAVRPFCTHVACQKAVSWQASLQRRGILRRLER